MQSIQWNKEGPRMTAWFSPASYSYARVTHKPNELFPDVVSDLIGLVNSKFGLKLNSVMCNLYRNGNDFIGRHSDDERELGSEPTIVSLSLGTERAFILHEKSTKKMISVKLAIGSVVLMCRLTQRYWQHEVPRDATLLPRMNLTFRCL